MAENLTPWHELKVSPETLDRLKILCTQYYTLGQILLFPKEYNSWPPHVLKELLDLRVMAVDGGHWVQKPIIPVEIHNRLREFGAEHWVAIDVAHKKHRRDAAAYVLNTWVAHE